MDYIIKFESMKEDLRTFYTETKLFDKEEIERRLEIIDLPLPNWKTKKRKPDYRKYYTPKLRRFVEKYWQKDLEKYDYKF